MRPGGKGLRTGAWWAAALPLCTMVAASAQAGWQGQFGVETGLIFTDNLYLSTFSPEADSVLRLRPTISSTRNGARVQGSFNYAPSVLLYADHQDLNAVQHVLDAALKTELVEDLFFIDLRAGANQVLGDSGGRLAERTGRNTTAAGFDSTINSGAFDQVYFLSLTPRLELPVIRGDFATVQFEPGLGSALQVSNNGSGRNGVSRSGSNIGTEVSDTRLALTGGSRFDRTPWRLQWRSRVFDNEAGDKIGEVTFSQGYVINRRYRLDALLGYDSGTYTAQDGRDSGMRWELRMGWTPRAQSSLQVGFGQAFYGDFWSLQAQHRHKRWALQANYRVSVENGTSTVLSQQVVPLTDIFGNTIVDPLSGNVLTTNLTAPGLNDAASLNQQFTAGLGWQGRRNSAQLDWTLIQREYSTASQDTTDQEVRLAMSRRLSPRSTARFALRFWGHDEQSLLGDNFQQDSIELSLDHQLGRRTTLSTRLARQNRDGDGVDNSFSEHRLSVNLSFKL